MSQELEKYNPNVRLAESLKQLDLTCIFNAHGTAEHAEQTTALIQPNSLVFIEGVNVTVTDGEHPLNYLSDLRLFEGPDSPKYIDFRSRILKMYKSQVGKTTDNPLDFNNHTGTLAAELIEKDCLVYVTDYDYAIGANQRSATLSDMINQGYTALEDWAVGKNNSSTHSTARYVYDNKKREMMRTAFHHVREGYATTSLSSRVMGLAALPQDITKNFRDDSTDKIRTFLVFGVAHKRSITESFMQMGILPKVAEVQPLDEYEYIDTRVALDTNIRRRIAMSALGHVTRDADLSIPSEELQQAYESFGRFNQSTGRQDFYLYMAQAVRLLELMQGNDDTDTPRITIDLRAFLNQSKIL